MKTFWSHLIDYIPKPEIEEIERIIGKKLIDKNEVIFTLLFSFFSFQFDFYSFFEFSHISNLKKIGFIS